MQSTRKVVIVGGVAAGASCAARLRRLDEKARIILVERGPHISFANCGLPYFIAKIIREEEDLLVASPDLFARQFDLDIRVSSEVTHVDPARHEVVIRDLREGRIYRESYTALVLAPGASPTVPELPGLDLPGVFTLRSIPDSREIKEWIDRARSRKAVVVGASYLGLEMTESLKRVGMEVAIVEALPQVMPSLDPEMSEPVAAHLEKNLIDLHLGDGMAAVEVAPAGNLSVRTIAGLRLEAGLVILALGVRPEVSLARSAGLEIGQMGGIRVDEEMRTNVPDIWAAGDAVEVRNVITGEWGLLALAGPASRQGRAAADSICGRKPSFRGVQGTGVCGIFGLTVATTGASEKMLRRAGIEDFEAIYLHPTHHASYYPGARRLHLKLIFSRSSGRVLGAQAVGEQGVEKRIDVIAMAIQMRGTVYDLEEAELCYAPQYGSAKDPVNISGMIGSNVLRGDLPLADWRQLVQPHIFILDVRDASEFAAGHIAGSVNIPLAELRQRLEEIPREREIWVNCAVGQRSYNAVRMLLQNSFDARHLSGGYEVYWGYYP